MTDERYRAFSHQISRVATADEGSRLGATLRAEPPDDDRDTLLRSLTQHMAMIGVLEVSEATS